MRKMKNNERVSGYIIKVPFETRKDLVMLAHGLYGAFDIIEAREAIILEDAQEEPSALHKLDKALLKRLRERGYITTATCEEELENAKIISRLYWLLEYESSVDLVVIPTYNCNFRCEYCYERKRLEKGKEFLKRLMTTEMVDAIFHQMEAYKSKYKRPSSCILYGGEPLLRANKNIVEYICKKAQLHGMSLQCVTNGYDLDEYIDILKEYTFKFVQITVDGVGHVHDSRRYLTGGQGSYERIMQNIKKALDKEIDIHLRVNVNRSNFENLSELADEFYKLGYMASKNFHPYFKATIACFEDDSSNIVTDEELFFELCRLGLCTENNIRVSRVYSEMAHQIKLALRDDAYARFKPANCGAESNMLVVDPDGKIYTCWDVVCMDEHCVGSVERESGRFLLDFDYSKWRARTVDQMNDCILCPYLLFCGGGCAFESLSEKGSFKRGSCGCTKQAFRYVSSRMCASLYEKTGERALNRSLYEVFANLEPDDRQTLLTTISRRSAHEIVQRLLPEGMRFIS